MRETFSTGFGFSSAPISICAGRGGVGTAPIGLAVWKAEPLAENEDTENFGACAKGVALASSWIINGAGAGFAWAADGAAAVGAVGAGTEAAAWASGIGTGATLGAWTEAVFGFGAATLSTAMRMGAGVSVGFTWEKSGEYIFSRASLYFLNTLWFIASPSSRACWEFIARASSNSLEISSACKNPKKT